MLELCSTSELAPGCVVPDLTEGNLRQRDAVVSALREALGNVGRTLTRCGGDSSRRGGAGRLLDFETLPQKREEAEGVVRFRLRKSLPFDVDKAKVSYQAQTSPAGMRVVAAVALNSVVEEYEAAFVEAGFSPAWYYPPCLRLWVVPLRTMRPWS